MKDYLYPKFSEIHWIALFFVILLSMVHNAPYLLDMLDELYHSFILKGDGVQDILAFAFYVAAHFYFLVTVLLRTIGFVVLKDTMSNDEKMECADTYYTVLFYLALFASVNTLIVDVSTSTTLNNIKEILVFILCARSFVAITYLTHARKSGSQEFLISQVLDDQIEAVDLLIVGVGGILLYFSLSIEEGQIFNTILVVSFLLGIVVDIRRRYMSWLAFGSPNKAL